jgi:hypothetical protein
VSIFLDSGAHKVDLALVQELQAESAHSLLWEIDNDKIGTNTKNTGKNAFEDEDPAPSRNAGQNTGWAGRIILGRTIVLAPPNWSRAVVLELAEAIGKNTSEGRGHGSDQVENSIALLELIARIPAGKKISTT